MARYGIDAATLVHVFDHDLELDPAHQLVAPNSIRSEALQLLLDDVALGQRAEKSALAIHERMTQLKMRLLGDRVSRSNAWKIARQCATSIRSAEYLAVTRLQADALVTVDATLTAMAEGVVPVAALDELLVK